jgi:hypothetical protein
VHVLRLHHQQVQPRRVHLFSDPVIDRDTDWYKISSCIVNWIYTTYSLEVLHIVHKSKKEIDAFSLWTTIHALYHDNQLQHVIFYKAEFHNLYQGDLSITDYCAKLKSMADNLRDVGQPVSEPSQVLNLLRGLNPKYRHAISAITSCHPPYMFLSARSHLLMEELFDKQLATTVTTHALLAKQGTSSQHSAPSAPPMGNKNIAGSSGRDTSGGSGGSTSGNGGGGGNKMNSGGRGSSSSSSSTGSASSGSTTSSSVAS